MRADQRHEEERERGEDRQVTEEERHRQGGEKGRRLSRKPDQHREVRQGNGHEPGSESGGEVPAGKGEAERSSRRGFRGRARGDGEKGCGEEEARGSRKPWILLHGRGHVDERREEKDQEELHHGGSPGWATGTTAMRPR